MSIKTNEILNEIIIMSGNLNELYVKLAAAKTDKNEEEISKLSDFIDMSSEYETKLYSQIEITNDTFGDLVNKFYLLLINEKNNKYDKDFIYSRFYNYINDLTVRNPFLSMEESIQNQEDENIAAIERQVKRDYTLTYLFLLSKEIENTTDPTTKYILWDIYCSTIYVEKSLENYLKEFPKHPEKSGRERCILFNQNKILVNEIYLTVLRDYLTQDIQKALTYTDLKLKRTKKNQADLLATSLSITATNMILENEERKHIPLMFSGKETKNCRESCKKVLQALRNGVSMDENYQKRKVYNSK